MTQQRKWGTFAKCAGAMRASALTLGIACGFAAPAAAQDAKPNILFIMGDDIGWMQPSIYHRGLAVGETPNIDRIGNEGATFMTYYAEQSCTAGRTAFITGMQPVRVGMVLPEIPGSPSYLRTGTPVLARFLHDLGYNTGEFGKNHLGDHTDRCRPRMASRSSGAISITSTPCRGLASPTSTRRRPSRRHRAAVQEHADPRTCRGSGGRGSRRPRSA